MYIFVHVSRLILPIINFPCSPCLTVNAHYLWRSIAMLRLARCDGKLLYTAAFVWLSKSVKPAALSQNIVDCEMVKKRIFSQKERNPCGFCAMAAAVVIGFRYACGYEYTGVLRTYSCKTPARKSPAQAISPKKLSKPHPRGPKKIREKPVFLLSCYPVNTLLLVCFT